MSQTQVAKAEKTEKLYHVQPAVDVLESEEAFLLLADLPGVDVSKVDLSIEKGQIQLKARREATEITPAVQYERRFLVPREIDANQIHASMNRGVLTLQLPKAAAPKPRRIEISID